MNTPPGELVEQIRKHLAAVPPETWESVELEIVLAALTQITERRSVTYPNVRYLRSLMDR